MDNSGRAPVPVLNQSADYALRATLFLARHDGGELWSAQAIAGALGVPRNYLSKVLHALARAEVVSSGRGPAGGFCLAVRPEALTLAAVVEPFQRMPERRRCLLGDRPCDRADACGSHRKWQLMSDQLTDFFRETTVASMLEGSPGVGAQGSESSAG